MSKRDEFLNKILSDKSLQLIAVAGTHGKTTTTAMLVWLFRELGVQISYSVGAKISFGDMGAYQPESQYFVYECDEFDRNFLAFHPHTSLITGVTWDHQEVFPTREDYQQAFVEFISQSKHTVLWQEDFEYLGLNSSENTSPLQVEQSSNPLIRKLELLGKFNRLDAWLAVQTVHRLAKAPLDDLIAIINTFPGLQRRMELITPGLYSDYAHTPEKIRGAMSAALEQANLHNQNLVVLYEPLTNRRQHYMIDEYKDCFAGANTVYWLPSYLAREDPSQQILEPATLISHLADPKIAQPANKDTHLLNQIKVHLSRGDMVVAMAGGGGDSLDEWIRQHFGRSQQAQQ